MNRPFKGMMYGGNSNPVYSINLNKAFALKTENGLPIQFRVITLR